MQRMQKNHMNQQFDSVLNNFSTILFVQYNNVTSEGWDTIKRRMMQHKVRIKVTKNTILKKSLSKKKLVNISSILSGPMAVLYSNDPSSIKDVLKTMSTSTDLILLGGKIEKTFYSAPQLNRFKDLTKEKTLPKLVLSTLSPSIQLYNVIKAPAVRLKKVISFSKNNK